MTETAPPTRFSHPVRVYWEDTDAGGIVFYANYLKFFERARTEWLRSLGLSQQRLLRERSVLFVVAETSVRYLRPARLDDLLELSVAVADTRRVAIVVEQQALRVDAGGAELLATGTIRLGCVDAATFKPRPIPSDILHRLI